MNKMHTYARNMCEQDLGVQMDSKLNNVMQQQKKKNVILGWNNTDCIQTATLYCYETLL